MKNVLMTILIAVVASYSYGKAEKQKIVQAKVPNLSKNQIALFQGVSYKVFDISNESGIRFASCPPKVACKAKLAAAKTKSQIVPSKFNGSPSSQLCSELGGNNLLAINSSKNEINVCEFSDSSLAYSWDLYDKLYPAKTIK